MPKNVLTKLSHSLYWSMSCTLKLPPVLNYNKNWNFLTKSLEMVSPAGVARNMDNWAVRVQPDLADVHLQLVVQLVKSQTSLVDGGRTTRASLFIRAGTWAGVFSSRWWRWRSYSTTSKNSSSISIVTGAGVRCGGGLGKSMLTCSSIVARIKTGSSAVETCSDWPSSLNYLGLLQVLCNITSCFMEDVVF